MSRVLGPLPTLNLEMREKPWVAVLVVRDEIERKLRHKHNITSAQVKEAILYGAQAEARWDVSPEYGERLILKGVTYDGTPVIAIVHPVDESDGVWELRTAFVRKPND